MTGPCRKVERITVHSNGQLWSVLYLAGLAPGDYDMILVHDRLRRVGSWHAGRFSVFETASETYTIYYTPGE
jgi:hypothetical protein